MRSIGSSLLAASLFASAAYAQTAPAPSPATIPATAATAESAPPPAERPVPDRRLLLNNLLVLRSNPLGLEDQIRFGYQMRLYRNDKPLFRDNFFFAGIYPRVNPAFIKFGPSVEVQPLSILNLRFGLEYVDFFSTFGYLQSFNSPLVNYSDTVLNAREDQGLNYATEGMHFMFEPTVQMKFGPIAIRDKLAAEYWNMKVHAGDKVFYDATLDTLVPANGWVLTNDLDVLYLTKFRLTVGARYSVVHPFYRASDYQPGEDASSNPNGHQRLGALVAYTFFDTGWGGFNKPTLLAILSWYLEHRWRTGADTSQAYPYFVLGFAFQSDLLQ